MALTPQSHFFIITFSISNLTRFRKYMDILSHQSGTGQSTITTPANYNFTCCRSV